MILRVNYSQIYHVIDYADESGVYLGPDPSKLFDPHAILIFAVFFYANPPFVSEYDISMFLILY